MAHRARKRFGQHFLENEAILQAMVDSIRPKASDHLVEIGPGLGALTQLLVHEVGRLDAIEIDRDLVKILKERFDQFANFHLHSQDVLHFPWADLPHEGGLRVVGNLPYNISTPLMFSLFHHLDLITDMYFLLQREVAERIASKPSSKRYGRLSVMSQYYCDADVLFPVAAEDFNPKPKVESAFIRLTPKPLSALSVVDQELMQKVVTEAFCHRRKTLSNSLQALISISELESLGINPKLRAENLSVEDYISISNHLAVE